MANNPGIGGVDARDATSSLVGNSAQSQQFFDRLLTPPTIAREALYCALIDALVAAGIWALLDCLYVFAAFDQVTALTNLVNGNSQAKWTFGLGAFTADRGLSPHGSTVEIYYGFDPTSGGNFAQNSACLFAWNRTAAATSSGSLISQNATTTARIQFSAGNAQWAINHAALNTVSSIADASGLWLANRSNSSSSLLTRNNVSQGTSAAASVALNAGAFAAGGGTDGTAQIAVVGAGASLSAGQQTSLFNAINTYLVAVGAA